MIFQSESGYIFGGYSPCQWSEDDDCYGHDYSLTSFLFSQTHVEIYPMKENSEYNAIFTSRINGPVFGNDQGYGNDLMIESDFKQGHSNLGYGYQWDQCEDTYSNHLFGQNEPNIIECEIYELKLI
ncbi:unnamed protein product [Paramecium octaurelia]|uniref:TLDc domain-containing protein n=1 Tax=Paramecium octaurelia TaxID=43137 RepID=A0A8S1X0S0_PAROT|nr:unnamed protein product [Paramecium octaurelia]